jgi:bacterioferritin-associated ferredoxin
MISPASAAIATELQLARGSYMNRQRQLRPVLMYVCLCNALTDSHVRDAASNGANRPSEVYRACGCAVQCGTCAATVRGIVKSVAQPLGRPAVPPAE